MVKMSETIICQRFVQNTWKKDLCSNCFKSKEDHVVLEKKITYRWTSHVDNFPQHGILRRDEKRTEKRKPQTVSFDATETEIIGYGGEECSSDDEFYPSYNDDPVLEVDNDEDKEFRKLTQTNTDFNSVPANLRNDKVTNGTKTYSNLKLGTPQTDADGKRQTLHVSVEPFRNSVTVNGSTALSNDRKVHLNKVVLEAGKDEKTECVETAMHDDGDSKNVVLSKQPDVCDINANSIDKCTVNVTNVNVETINEENVYSKSCADNAEKLIRITNVLVNVAQPVDEKPPKDEVISKEIAENMKNAKCKLEPLFKHTYDSSPPKRLSIYQSSPEDKRDDQKRLSFKDSNPIALPLITSKDLEIEIDRPGSREMVGEPDGKADSDDSGDPAVSPEYLEESKTDAEYVNPQRSFLHGFLKEKPSPVGCNNVKTPVCKEPPTINSVPSTPKMQIPNGTGSTKRQAPKPPSTPQTPIQPQKNFVLSTPISVELAAKKCETDGPKRRLDSNLFNRNSLNLNLTLETFKINGCTTPTASVNGDSPGKDAPENATIRGSAKCIRSLSCDSIVSPNITLSEKTRKYSGATIKVKSTIRKFLRFNKDDEKCDEVQITAIPRRRIEIIHPLDLNTSSIEILPPANAEDPPKIEHQNETKITPTPPSCPPGRPTKPPPPPRTQSLDQKIVSEISKPVRPPPPKSVNFKAPPPPKYECLSKTSTNVYENLGESRQSVAPAKPQRASSIRERARQQTTIIRDEMVSSVSEREAVPECDRSAQSDSSETPPSSSIPYCGSETESEMYQSVASSTTDSSQSEFSDAISETEQRKGKSVVHSCLEDNYGAVVVANHETLSQLLDQLNQTSLVPNVLKVLQTTLHIRFEHLVVVECSKISVSDWNFYNAKWNGHDVVVSISTKPLGPLKALPSSVTLFPLVKFTDLIPSRYVKNDIGVEDVNAYITVWNEQKIESISCYCNKSENLSVTEGGLLLNQLTNAFNHLMACGIEDISLNEIFICRRDSDFESKLLLLPINIDYISNNDKNPTKKMSLCQCIFEVVHMLLPRQQISHVIKRIISDEKATSLSQAKAAVEYWLWGPCDVTLTNDRQAALQRWLDLERANYLQKVVCKKHNEFSLGERCHLVFLVRTNAKLLTEASYLLEKQ